MSGNTSEGGEAREGTAADLDGGAYPAIARSLTARHDGSPCVDRGPNIVAAGFAYKASAHAGGVGFMEETGPTLLSARHDAAVYDARGNGDGAIAPTMTGLTCFWRGGMYSGGSENIAVSRKTVRRLTPLECDRLNGYPDNHTLIPNTYIDGKLVKCSDSARYRAQGNSIALPPWRFVMSRICQQIGYRATLGSLFDGIGGFPLIWEEINGKGSARWASEIDPFCVAVTKYHFEEEGNHYDA